MLHEVYFEGSAIVMIFISFWIATFLLVQFSQPPLIDEALSFYSCVTFLSLFRQKGGLSLFKLRSTQTCKPVADSDAWFYYIDLSEMWNFDQAVFMLDATRAGVI